MERIPAGYQKMVRARIYGGVEATWLMFTLDVKHTDIQLADAALEGTGGACTMLVIQNKGSQSVQLKTDMTLWGLWSQWKRFSQTVWRQMPRKRESTGS